MDDPTVQFFRTVAERRHEPLLGKAIGTVRFDLDHDGTTEHWLVTVDRGDISVSQADERADAVFHSDKALFDRAVIGQANGLAAVLRGAASIEGDVQLLVYVLRLFPGPASAEGRRRATDGEGGPQ